MDAATIINRASARRLTRRSVLAGLLASAAARAMAPLGGATPGGGGGPLSSLATLISGMASQTFARWTAGDISSSIINPGLSDPVCSNSSRCNWDPIGKKIQFYGHGHTGQQSLMCDFTDATSTWSNAGTPPVASNPVDNSHQWTGQTGDPITGDVYFWWAGGSAGSPGVYRRLQGSNSWTSLPSSPSGDGHGEGKGATFNPHFGTSGGLYLGSSYGIDVWDVHNASWSNQWPGGLSGGIVIGDSSGFEGTPGFYDETAQAVYFCGGNSPSSESNARCTKAGVTTQRANLPGPAGFPAAFNSQGIVVDGYVSTCTLSGYNTAGTVRPPMLIIPGGSCWEYNSTSDTWNVISGLTAPNYTQTNAGYFGGNVPLYDCVTAFAQTGGNGDMSAYAMRRS